MENLSDLFRVQINFDTSHLLFPSIIEWALVVLLAAIAVVHGPRLVSQWRQGSMAQRVRGWDVDKKRLYGCLVLTPIYFAAMEPVGEIYPNAGIGFLLTSFVYGLALSWLFVRDNNRRKTVLMSLTAIITPTVVWFVFAHIFRITLP